jgi:hypothetical protein
LNDLSDQTVMVFAGTAARGSAIPSPSEGMVTYRSDDDVVEVFDGSVFAPVGVEPAILQVVSTTKTDTFSSSATTPTDITGASVTITPSSTSSKVLVMFDFSVSSGGVNSVAVQLLRGATNIGGGAASGSRLSAITTVTVGGNGYREQESGSFLDSPSTTSAVTYSLKGWGEGATWYIGQNASDPDTAGSNAVRTPLTITAMEVAG